MGLRQCGLQVWWFGWSPQFYGFTCGCGATVGPYIRGCETESKEFKDGAVMNNEDNRKSDMDTHGLVGRQVRPRVPVGSLVVNATGVCVAF
ncbi:hypothetical protein Taro_036888 [Colocasia esculenta]|uniref:Uncharacterized protein n=1 Tax=Colocasia esculenta TaxID=4460 RepID=A0A843WHM0_COLES|nr:hypothetical protein [Colocasia esculenta]